MNSIFLFAIFFAAAQSSGSSNPPSQEAKDGVHSTEKTEVRAPQKPTAIAIPAARYPRQLVRSCKGGRVEFTFTVLENGSVEDIQVLSSPSDELTQVVVSTVKKKWRFTPYDAGLPKKLARLKTYMTFDPEC
jgi:TonB family protein